jgi:hypothetical protein
MTSPNDNPLNGREPNTPAPQPAAQRTARELSPSLLGRGMPSLLAFLAEHQRRRAARATRPMHQQSIPQREGKVQVAQRTGSRDGAEQEETNERPSGVLP